MVHIDCPGCGKKLRARNEDAGKRGRCRKCGTIIFIPDSLDEEYALATDNLIDAISDYHAEQSPVAGGSSINKCEICGNQVSNSQALCSDCAPDLQIPRAGESSYEGRGILVDAELPGPGTFLIEVVGESHYQEALEDICGGRDEDGADFVTIAVLILEDENPHDPKAVRIEIDGQVVGYLSRENARQYRAKLREAGHSTITASCTAVIRGGWDRGDGDRAAISEFDSIYQPMRTSRLTSMPDKGLKSCRPFCRKSLFDLFVLLPTVRKTCAGFRKEQIPATLPQVGLARLTSTLIPATESLGQVPSFRCTVLTLPTAAAQSAR